MRITENKIIFEYSDMKFVKKFGAVRAADMVFEYKSLNSLPFIYDTDQLARFLKLGTKDLFLLSKNCSKFYEPLLLKKKNGKVRQLYAPNDYLKERQHIILSKIISKLPVSEYATAYKEGSSLFQNALPHVGKRYLLKMDITDFFGSISSEQVYCTAFNTRYYPKQIGLILTELCCKNGFLPQGAPTSPALSNIVMRNFDNNIGYWCDKHGISYTRYCDDMTFSSDKPLYAVYQKVREMLEEMFFELNEKKTHFITNANRQSVTGLTVNDKVSVSAEYKRKLRQEVYYALKYGLSESIIYADKKDFMVNGVPNTEKYYNNLLGRIAFVLQIEPENTWFQNALMKLKTNKS